MLNLNQPVRVLCCDWKPGISRRSTHYSDVIMSTMASKITDVSIVDSHICSGADQRKHQSSASQALPCKGNSLVTSEFPAQRASNVENVSIWWRHHDCNSEPFSYGGTCGIGVANVAGSRNSEIKNFPNFINVPIYLWGMTVVINL